MVICHNYLYDWWCEYCNTQYSSCNCDYDKIMPKQIIINSIGPNKVYEELRKHKDDIIYRNI